MERSKQRVVNPLPENLLRRPIDYLEADHLRQRKICDLLDHILDSPDSSVSPADIRLVLDYLTVDLPHHVADEEDLFPRLKACCPPSDQVESLIDILNEEHRRNAVLLEKTEAALLSYEARGEADSLDPAVAVFAEAKRRHIRLENELLLPLARARLGAEDFRALGRSMAMRRGVPYPE